MRTIRFRAKALSDGRWRILTLNNSMLDALKISSDYEEEEFLDMRTLGMSTGKHDICGKEIFEGDVIAFQDTYSTDSGTGEGDCTGKIIWDEETLSFGVTGRLSAESYEVLEECRVIGNIVDNPELLG